MKRFLALLLAALLCLAAAGCSQKNKPAPEPQPEPEPEPIQTVEEPVRLEVLNVECTTSGQAADDLTALQQLALPEAMARGLEAQNYALARTHVTFGTSAEATVQALLSGAVDVGLLPAEAFLTHEEELTFLALADGEAQDTARSVACAAALDEPLTAALRAVFDGLSLPLYTEGVYSADAGALDPLRRAMAEEPAQVPEVTDPTQDHVLTAGTARVKGYEPLRIELIGKQTGDGGQTGVCRIDVYDANYLIQSIELKEAIDADGVDGIARGYTECSDRELLFFAEDVSFDGSDDLAICGWQTTSTPVYYYYLWNTEKMIFEYGFCLQDLQLDPARQRVLSSVRLSAASYRTDTYAYEDGRLKLIDSAVFGPEIDAREAAEAYYRGTVFTVEEMELVGMTDEEAVFSVTVSKDGELQEVPRTITLEFAEDEWTVTDEGW